jgi:putative Mn2+ efflux pump MntP
MAVTMRIRSGTAVLVVLVNLLLIPLLSAGLVHLAEPLLPWSMGIAAATLLLTSLAWIFRPPLGAVLQIAAGAIISSIVLVQPHYTYPRTPFRATFELLALLPLAVSILAAVLGLRRRHVATRS